MEPQPIFSIYKPEDMISDASDHNEPHLGIPEGMSKSFEVSEIVRDVQASNFVDNPRDISYLINGVWEVRKVEDTSINKQIIGAKPGRLEGDQARYMERLLNRKREINLPILNKNRAEKAKKQSAQMNMDLQRKTIETNEVQMKEIEDVTKLNETPCKPQIEETKVVFSTPAQTPEPHGNLTTSPSEPVLRLETSSEKKNEKPKILTPLASCTLRKKPSNECMKEQKTDTKASSGANLSREEERKIIEDMIAQGNSIFNVSCSY